MKINIQLEKIVKDFYYFSICGIPFRVWKDGGLWYNSSFNGMNCIGYNTRNEAVNEAVSYQYDNSKLNYKCYMVEK